MDLDWLWEGSISSRSSPRPPRQRPRGSPKSRCRCVSARPPPRSSRKTLAEAKAAGSQVLSWRGDTVQSIEVANRASLELGHHYRDCVLAKAAHDRRRAARWARANCGNPELGANQMGPRNSVSEAVHKAVTEPAGPVQLDEHPVEKRFSLQAASQKASLARRLSLMNPVRSDRPESKSASRRQSLQLSSLERRKSQQPTHMMKYNRLQRLLAAKQAEFDALPEHQQQRLRMAFNRAKGEDARCIDKKALNASQLRQALTEIKLTGRMVHEKEESWDSHGDVKAVTEVIRESVAAGQVTRLDAVGTGSLSSADCIEALRRHADSFSTILDGELMDQLHGSDRWSWYGMGRFWPIYVKELSQAEHFGEIALMMRYFRRYDPASRGVVSAEQVVMALMDSGTLPVVGRLHHQMMSAYANHASRLIVFRFQDFMEQVDTLRREENAVREAAFRSWYTIHKWSDENTIPLPDIPQLIMDLSLVSDSCRNVQDVRLLVDDVHRDPSESLHIDAATKLAGRVVETARVQARRREAMVADQVNFSLDQVLSLRSSFSEMTHSGVIGPDDLHDLLVELFPDHEIDDSFVQDLLDAALPSGYFQQNSSKPPSRPKREETMSKKTAQDRSL
eukprot:Skav222912  [mRNA]  locus=scaffold1489:207079:215130:+ [translate_table: standard]